MKSASQYDCIRAGSRALIRTELASRIQIQVSIVFTFAVILFLHQHNQILFSH